jgi:uncharacterized protein YllA (UPF0747 family)
VYLWQIRPVYEAVQATPSLLQPRISATFVEQKIKRAAEKAGLGTRDLFEAGTGASGHAMMKEADPEIDGFEEEARTFLAALGGLGGEKAPRWLERSRSALTAGIEKLLGRLREARREEQGLVRARLEKIRMALLPQGKPQERVANLFQFLNLYGPDFVHRCVESLDPLCEDHQVVYMKTE